MTNLVFDVFAADDLSGASIGTLTEATGKMLRVHHNDFGNGQFTINRHSSEASLGAADNYVRCKLTGGSYISGFFLEEGADVLVSEDEQGGETLTRGGRGPLAYLERAILMPTESAAGPGTVTDGGNWEWTDQTIGAILDHVLSDAQALTPNPLPLLTWTFDATNDSAGDPWDTIDGTFQLPIGMDYLSVIARFQSGGVTIRMDEDFTLHAWNDPPGTDVSGTVSFVKGVNIREAADRRIHASPAKSRIVVQGTTVDGVLKFRTVTHPDYTAAIETAIGARYGFTRYGATPSNTMLDRAGRQLIKKLKRQKDGPSAVGVLNTPVPFTDYQPGDTVHVDIPGQLDDLDVELAAITLKDDEADGYETIVEFEDAPYDPLEGIKTGVTSAGGGSGGVGGGGGDGGLGGEGADTCGGCGSCDDCPPIGSPDLVGSDLGTESWPDREYEEHIGRNAAGGSETIDPAVTDVDASRTWFAAPSTPRTELSRTYIRHLAPVGASYARLRADVYTRRTDAGDPQFMTPTIYVGANTADWNEAGPFASFDDVGAIVWSRVMTTGANPAYAGPFTLECVLPVVDGSVAFVFGDAGSAPASPSEAAQWYAVLQAPGEALGGGDKYELTYYGAVSGTYVGGRVTQTPVAEADGSETIFSTPTPYSPGSLQVWDEGKLVYVDETDPTTGQFTFPYTPPDGHVISVAYSVSDTTPTGVPITAPTRELGPVPGSDIADVAGTEAAGTSREYAAEDHVHRGIGGITADGGTVYGVVSFVAGSNVTITRSGQNITLASSGGGGGGGTSRIVDFGTDGVQFDTGIGWFYDQNGDASIGIDAGVYITSLNDGIYLDAGTGYAVKVTSNKGMKLPVLSADPSGVDDGTIYYNDTTNKFRGKTFSGWVDLH